MAQMRDISTSILATEGSEVKTGVLLILEKQKGIKMLKSTDYQLNPLYWRLVSYAAQTYLLGYPRQLGGAKATKKLLVKGCSIEMNLPEKVVVSPHNNESFLCIQCGEKNFSEVQIRLIPSTSFATVINDYRGVSTTQQTPHHAQESTGGESTQVLLVNSRIEPPYHPFLQVLMLWNIRGEDPKKW
ncbi:uncharacterized protein LOC105437717 [Strongylocentrotus purpuratus]|uniref:Uncharacterized protein n=1 Tax=Strongylocentrotus purpuratus TaxID=7668 RepID=A0A7M7PM72_STRPU|nr:uncharacterized protein LOC105437717 [Strongylocentrotus purpuratus]